MAADGRQVTAGRLLVTVDPNAIDRSFVRRSSWDKLRFGLNGLGQPEMLRSGSWDRRTIPVTQHPGYRLIRELADNQFEPEASHETLVRYFRDKGRSVDRASRKAAEEGDAYIRQYHALFQSMKASGYVPNLAADEIGLAVDREGRWVKVPNGNHRFHTALVLGLSLVTAEVRFVHRRWILARSGPGPADMRSRIAYQLQENGVQPYWC